MEKTVRRGKLVPAILIAITVAGLGLRLGYAIEQPADPPPDAEAYARIAESLYRDGAFDARPPGATAEAQPSSAYSPGLPLFVAAVYELTGGVHLTFALVLLALIGAAAIPLSYLLGARFAGPVAGLVGAGVVAVYPALLDYQGLLLTEPLAATLLAAGLVLFFAAADGTGSTTGRGTPVPWGWLASGAVFGLLALVRPEYLPVALGLPFLSTAREALRGRGRAALLPLAATLAATCVVLAPWTVRNAVELDRFVPVSTGGGKALYIGTYVGADGDGPRLRELLLDERPALKRRFEAGGPLDDPGRLILERVLARVAAEEEPGLETDAALGRLGRRNLEEAIADEPGRVAGMWAAKAYETWTDAARSVMLRQPWRALQLAVVVLGLAGLAILAWRRRFEALVSGGVLLYMTAIAALLIASPRRELVVLPLLAALAGVVCARVGSLTRP